MNVTLKKQIEKSFIQTLQDLKNIKEKETFFKDFLDEKEFENLVKRLAIAYWLKKGRDGGNIKNNLEVDDKEIGEVRKNMDTKGIKLALKYLEAEEWANVWVEKFKKFRNRL